MYIIYVSSKTSDILFHYVRVALIPPFLFYSVKRKSILLIN